MEKILVLSLILFSFMLVSSFNIKSNISNIDSLNNYASPVIGCFKYFRPMSMIFFK